MDRDPSCYEHHEVAVGPDCKHTQSNHAQLKLRALSADEHRLQRSSELRVHTEADRTRSQCASSRSRKRPAGGFRSHRIFYMSPSTFANGFQNWLSLKDFSSGPQTRPVWSKISNVFNRLGFRSRNFFAQLLSETSRACTIRVRRSSLRRLWNDLGSHACLHHRNRRPGTTTEERVSGRGEPHP